MTVRRCCIINCNNTSRNSDVSFFGFPKYKHKLIQKDKWISIVRKQNGYTSSWNPTSKDLICSAHFIGGKKGEEELSPNYVPSKFSSPQGKSKLNEETVLARHKRFVKRRLQNTSLMGSSSKNNKNASLNSKSAASTEVSMDITISNVRSVYENENDCDGDLMIVDSSIKSTSDVECQADIFAYCNSVEKILFCNNIIEKGSNTCDAQTQTEINVPNCGVKINTTKKFRNQKCGTPQKLFVDRGVGSDCVYNEFVDDAITFQGSVTNDKQLRDLAGVSFETYNYFLDKLTVSEKIQISKKIRLFIFLFKLKTALTFAAIGAIFSVHRTTVSRIFYSTLENLAEATRSVVFWPDRSSVRAAMPNCFKPQYSDTRVIIDCTEFRIDIPSKSDDRVHCYSHYKKGFTLKVLMGITPDGFICFKSPAAGGGKSDSQITVESGFIDLLEDGDVVLADKEFPEIKTITDRQGKKVTVIMPPFLEIKSEFSQEEKNYNVARVRIHVERIMQQLRTYNILNKIPDYLFDYVDNIIHMCCVMVNLRLPIFDDKHQDNDNE